MKIVNIIGGLGNQIFQYAFAIALQKQYPSDIVKLNSKCLNGYPLHYGYELNKLFDVRLHECSSYELIKVAYPWISWRFWKYLHKIFPKRKTMVFEDDLGKEFDWQILKDKKYFEGYWQDLTFIEHAESEIKQTLAFPEITDSRNLEILGKLKSAEFAFVHIRRGDYVNHPLYDGICTEEYYKEGLNILINKYGYKHILVFSNDISTSKKMCENAIRNDCEIVYVDWNLGENSYRDLQLMTLCKGALIANSSFSWWGAWLGNPQVVICPQKWDNKKGIRNLIPKHWISI